RWRFASPVAGSRPSREFCSSAAMTLSFTWLVSISCHTRRGNSCGSTRLSFSVHSRSRMIAAAVIEQRMIGHISGPPARTISHIQAPQAVYDGGILQERRVCSRRYITKWMSFVSDAGYPQLLQRDAGPNCERLFLIQ